MDIESLAIRARLPFSDLLGIEYIEASKDHVVAAMLVRPDLCTVPAILHGGAIMAFADTLGAVATALNLPTGATTVTLESKTNFTGSAPVGTMVKGQVEVVHRGARTMVWQTRVIGENGKLVALVTQTQMVIPPKLT